MSHRICFEFKNWKTFLCGSAHTKLISPKAQCTLFDFWLLLLKLIGSHLLFILRPCLLLFARAGE
jgi:hypothetical protein